MKRKSHYDVSVPTPADPAHRSARKVVVELNEWYDRRKAPEGVITEVLGAPDAPGVDLVSIIRKHDLPTSFPENGRAGSRRYFRRKFPRKRNRAPRGFPPESSP